MVMTDELTSLLVAQRQVLTWRQLVASAGSRRKAEHLIQLGVFVTDRTGLWRLAGSSPGFEQRVMGAVLACGPDALAARQTAALLHGLRDTEPTTIQVVVGHGRTPIPRLPRVRAHRSRTLRPEDATDVGGIPCCTACRTIVDLAITLGVDQLRDLIARGLRLGCVDLASLSEQLEAAGRIHGAARMRAALCSLDGDAGLAQSKAEQVLYEALVAAGIGPIERQYAVDLPSGRAYLDMALVLPRVAVEVDGYWWHSTPQQKASDERRQNELVAQRWRPVRVGAGMVMRHPDRAVAQVRAVVEAA